MIQKRQGLVAWQPYIEHTTKSFEFADRIARQWEEWQADACFVDNSGGYGDGVINRLVQLGRQPFAVDFGGSSSTPTFMNKRVEMWVAVRDWLRSGGCLPNMPEYRIDLTSPRKKYPPSGKLGLESKVDMQARGMISPDVGDALALTFAAPVHVNRTQYGLPRQPAFAQTEYSPWDRN